jgi:predicted polyphosphate/ATP-dependent NAD kinase
MKRLGFLINPISGMGGSVGLKGTDGEEVLRKAIELGAEPVAENRASKTLTILYENRANYHFVTCSGPMGEDALKKTGYDDYSIAYETKTKTSPEDTRNACAVFMKENVDIIVFCGGDGTARDIYEVVGQKTPIIGVPTGVKMHSAVFGMNPRSAAEAVAEYIAGNLELKESEIMDIDEEKYRMGKLDVRLIGYALTPYRKALVQAGKGVYEGVSEENSKTAIADYVVEIMGSADTAYILCAGTTTKAIADKLGIEKTLLGVDIVRKGKLMAKDVNERTLLEYLEETEDAKIIVSPIGAQGFIFGRGNQQISSDVIRKAGIGNIILVATPHKLSQTEVLRVDTGDEELDKAFAGYRRVISG